MGASKQFLTSREYADRSGLSVAKVTKRLRNGDIKGQKRGGKWMIPTSELDAVKPPPAPSDSAPSRQGQAATPPPQTPPAAGRTLSIAEFSALTYLTEHGVRAYLKTGRIKGTQVEDGEWRIDAANLEAPHLKHLVR